ncbi:Ras-like protein family member 10B [Echinococcus granulosus]|uniref:Ras protein family 0B n=1 Tax=Echinococcus granulosus TaxID=6210 RepID=A0A068WUX0_ECHGR|nr:Ras-like protein family member 10B [Echinococcus granulosus]CDS23626.1 ras protein family 0B [Echinococcus granulosus]
MFVSNPFYQLESHSRLQRRSNSEDIPQARKISSHGGDRASSLCEAGGVQSSLKTAQGSKRASPTPKKLYFRIENNVFYDPVSEKKGRRHVRRVTKRKDGGCNTTREEKQDSRFKLFGAFSNASNLNAMVKMAACDPILTARHISDNGTARLASWTASEETTRQVTPKPRENATWMVNVRAWTMSAACGKSGIALRGVSEKASKPETVVTPKRQSKSCMDLSHVISHFSASRFTPPQSTSLTPPNVRTRSARENVGADVHCESSEEQGSDLPPLDLPRNPFESVIINIPVLGFRRCGKTSLLNSLVQTGPTRLTTSCTRTPTYYYPMVIFNYQVFNFRLIDCPMMVQDFPLSTLDAWADFRGWGLHVADFFILVFDITCEFSFQYVKLLREQILAANMDVPMVIVANKIDLIKSSSSTGMSHHSLTATPPSVQRSGRYNSRVFSRSRLEGSANLGEGIYVSCPPHISLLPHNHTSVGICQKVAFRRDVAVLVKKHWKGCVLVECSALYNFNTLAILREVLRFVQYRQCSQKLSTTQTVQAVWQRNQCCIL